MILFSIAFGYVMLSILFSLIGTQDENYKAKAEQDRQRKELRDALRENARMR